MVLSIIYGSLYSLGEGFLISEPSTGSLEDQDLFKRKAGEEIVEQMSLGTVAGKDNPFLANQAAWKHVHGKCHG